MDQLRNIHYLRWFLNPRQTDLSQLYSNLTPINDNSKPIITRVRLDDLVQLTRIIIQVVCVLLLVSLTIRESEDECITPAFQLLGLVDDE